MTTGIEQAVIIIVIFGIFYFLKVLLTIIGSILQLNKSLSKVSKVRNVLALLLLLLSWIPFAVTVFMVDGKANTSDRASLNLILNSLLFFTQSGAAILLYSSFKESSRLLSEKAKGFWLTSLLILVLNAVLVAMQFLFSQTENKMGYISAIWILETLFFVVFFITICLLKKNNPINKNIG